MRVHGRAATICGLTAALALGLAAGAASRAPPPLAILDDAPDGARAPRWIRGEIRSGPVPASDGARVLIAVSGLRIARSWMPAAGRTEIRVPEWPPPPGVVAGRQVEIFTALRPDRPFANPGASRRDRLRDRGIDRRGALKSWQQVRLGPLRDGLPDRAARWRHDLRSRLREGLGLSRHAALLRALLLGERDDLPASFGRTMATTGLVHLLAISGLHVGLLSGAAISVARIAGLGPRGASAAGLGLVALLALIVEARSPVRRAAVMALALLGTRLFGGRMATVDGLAAAVFVLLLGMPAAGGQLAFQLSTIATFAIVTGMGRDRPLVPALLRTSCIAQAAVAPLLALHFRALHPGGVMWNPVAVPLLSAALPLALLGTVAEAVQHGAADLPGSAARVAADAVLDVFLTLVNAAEPWSPALTVPSATVPLAAAYWAGLLLLLSTVRAVRAAGLTAVAVAAILALRPPPAASPSLTVLDVGQGDAVLFNGPQGALVYDAGGFPGIDFDVGRALVLPQLRRIASGRPRVVAMSHAHADHASGLPGLIAATLPQQVWMGASPVDDWLTARVMDAAARAGATALSPTSRLRGVGGCQWRAVAPGLNLLTAGARDVTNAASLALEGRCSGARILLAGDADTLAEQSWLAAGLGASAHPTILKVGHHGSATSTGAALIANLRPRYAVISVGATNPWGLPRASVVTRLLAAGIAVYRTDRDGAVTFTIGRGIRVRGERWVLGTRSSQDS